MHIHNFYWNLLYPFNKVKLVQFYIYFKTFNFSIIILMKYLGEFDSSAYKSSGWIWSVET